MVAPTGTKPTLEKNNISSLSFAERIRHQRKRSSPRSTNELNASTTSVDTSATRSLSLRAVDDVQQQSSETTSVSSGGVLKIRTQEESLSRSGLSGDTSDGNSDVDQDSASSSTSKKSATFSTLEFRDYLLILGDNPSTTSGPPLSIGWEYAETCTLEIDSYEESRGPRRQKEQLLVPRSMREDWLRELGYSRGEMKEVEELVQQTKKHRLHHAKQPIPIVKLEETSEKVQRKFKRWILRTPSDKELYREWSHNAQVNAVVGRVA